MKKQYKKMLAMLLTAALLLTLAPASALASPFALNDATLSKVAGQSLQSIGNQAGTDAAPITAAITVPYSVASIVDTDLTPTDAGATAALYNSTFTTQDSPATLMNGGTNNADTDIYVKVTSADSSATLHYKVTVTRVANDAPVITPRAMEDGMVGSLYQGTNITIPYYTPYIGRQIVSGALPDGLSIDTTSVSTSNYIRIEGTPIVAGTFTFAITITDSNGKVSAPVEFSITILADDRETVSFGGKQWLVISDGTSDIAPVANTLTLLSRNYEFGVSKFDGSSSKYKGSTLQGAMGTALDNLNLSASERGLIKKRTLTGSGEVYTTGTEMAGDNAVDQEFWPLSREEYQALSHLALSHFYRVYGGNWWLRSPANRDGSAYCGFQQDWPTSFLVKDNGVIRPAFHLNLASAIFTSAAAGGKADPAGANLSAAQPPTNFYKFTMKDHSLALAFALNSVTNAGSTLTVNYTGAAYADGENRTISAIVKDSGGDVTHYGKLKDITGAGDESGSVTVTLPGGFDPANDTLYLFVEQHNGDNYTDFASTPRAISSDASLLTVAGQTITATGDGTAAGTPKTAAITVANSVNSIAFGDIVAATGATAELYSDAAFSQNQNQPVSLSVGSGNHLYIKVTAQDGVTVVYYDVTVTRAAYNPGPGPTYTTRTLTDTPTGIKVTAGMDVGTRLNVTKGYLHTAGSCAACDEIRARQQVGDVLALYDISLTGDHTGPYKVYIPFGGGGGHYTVLHCNRGKLEKQSGPYANGGVTTTWARLSPFAVISGVDVTVPEDIVVNPPKTGDAGSPWGFVMMLVGVCGLVGLYAARRRKIAK